jgi:hypothetical protein
MCSSVIIFGCVFLFDCIRAKGLFVPIMYLEISVTVVTDMIASCDVAQVQKWGVDPEISVQLFQFA